MFVTSFLWKPQLILIKVNFVNVSSASWEKWINNKMYLCHLCWVNQVRPSRRRIGAEPHLQCRYKINYHSRLNINLVQYTLQTKHLCQCSNAASRRRSDSKCRLIKYTLMYNYTAFINLTKQIQTCRWRLPSLVMGHFILIISFVYCLITFFYE